MVKIKKTKAHTPDILKTNGAAATSALNGLSATDLLKHKFSSALYGGRKVKDVLKKLQKDKCCFCEAQVSHVSHGDVEHYRPKGGWVQKSDDKLTKPGYYWLAYDFRNLFLSCQICNQTYKKNYFPLVDASKRAVSHTSDIGLEKPLIIDPGNDEPAKYLTFHKEMAVARDDNAKGKETILRTGLNRDKSVARRFEYLKLLEILALVARSTSPQAGAARAKFKELGGPSMEYSLMVRSNFPDLAV